MATSSTKGHKMKEKMIIGVVRTSKVGSDCEFEICSADEWLEMSEKDRHNNMIESMWESGQVDVFVNDETP